METNFNTSELKSSAWGWTLLGALLTIATSCCEEIPLLAAIIPDAYALILWVIVSRRESEEDEQNKNLFE